MHANKSQSFLAPWQGGQRLCHIPCSPSRVQDPCPTFGCSRFPRETEPHSGNTACWHDRGCTWYWLIRSCQSGLNVDPIKTHRRKLGIRTMMRQRTPATVKVASSTLRADSKKASVAIKLGKKTVSYVSKRRETASGSVKPEGGRSRAANHCNDVLQ